MCQMLREYAEEKILEGINEGLIEGRNKGLIEGKIEMVKELVKDGMSFEKALKYAKLDRETYEKYATSEQ